MPGDLLSRKYKRLAKKALDSGRRLIADKQPAADVVVEVCKILENSHLTNAGTGSELTSSGTVEMDATITDGVNFASVGAIRQVKNPIEVAAMLYRDLCSDRVDLFGRSKPHFYGGAQITGNQILTQNIPLVDNEALVTDATLRRFLYWDQVYKGLATDDSGFSKTAPVTDTIGVICIDYEGHMCAASSSGGITYKDPGRIGPAAIHGAATHVDSRVGCCTSGYGEDIIQFNLASRITHALKIDRDNDSDESNLAVIQSVITELNERGHHQSKPLAVGGFAVCYESANSVKLILFHTTPSLVVGYYSGDDEQVYVSRVTEKSGYFQGLEIKLRPGNST